MLDITTKQNLNGPSPFNSMCKQHVLSCERKPVMSKSFQI
jgi:hypothetical protein